MPKSKFKTDKQRKAFFAMGGHLGARIRQGSKAEVDAIMMDLLKKGDIVMDCVPEDDDIPLIPESEVDSEITDYDEDGAEIDSDGDDW